MKRRNRLYVFPFDQRPTIIVAVICPLSTLMGALWHRIVAGAAPGMAAANAFYSKPKPFEQAVFFKGLHAVGAAGGCVAAGWAQEGRNAFLVQPDECHKGQGQYFKKFFHAAWLFFVATAAGNTLRQLVRCPIRAIAYRCTKKTGAACSAAPAAAAGLFADGRPRAAGA